VILHLAEAREWEATPPDGPYVPGAFAVDGFVHCSTAEQLPGTAERFYRGRHDLVLLVLDEDALGPLVRWEPPAPDDGSGRRFPHVYGPIPRRAVLAALPFRPGPDGRFPPPPAPPAGSRAGC